MGYQQMKEEKGLRYSAAVKICCKHFVTIFNGEVLNGEIKID